MANTLWVDVQGTLVDGLGSPRLDVISAVREHDHRHGRVRGTVIWTGMGRPHAVKTIERFFPDSSFAAMDKGLDMDEFVELGDVVVDDDEDIRGLLKMQMPMLVVLTPEQFVSWIWTNEE